MTHVYKINIKHMCFNSFTHKKRMVENKTKPDHKLSVYGSVSVFKLGSCDRTLRWERNCVSVLAVYYNIDSTYASKKMIVLYTSFHRGRTSFILVDFTCVKRPCCEWLTHLNSRKRTLYIYIVIHMCYCSYFNNFMVQTC